MNTEQGAAKIERADWWAIADVHPGSFSFIMATGIVSLACWQHRIMAIAWALFVLNCIGYCVVWLMNAVRVSRGDRMVEPYAQLRSPGVFAIVAGTCVVGSQFAQIANNFPAALALWLFATGLWLGFTYIFFTLAIIGTSTPTLRGSLDGAWLLAVVATQATAYLGLMVGPHTASWRNPILFLSLVEWLAGGMLYLLIITLIFYRLVFLELTPEDLTGPYWISMGALAISSLVGSTLVVMAPSWRPLLDTRPFLEGFTLFFWASGTWWIPLLLALGFWRHGIRRHSLQYDAHYWAIVFPLGMYAAATFDLAGATGITFLTTISDVFVSVASVAWLIVFLGMVATIRALLLGRVQWRHRAGHNA